MIQSNGTVVLVADKKEISDARDKITVPRHTPMECFGVDGLMDIEVGHRLSISYHYYHLAICSNRDWSLL